jgi:succinate-acetate transporter protein
MSAPINTHEPAKDHSVEKTGHGLGTHNGLNGHGVNTPANGAHIENAAAAPHGTHGTHGLVVGGHKPFSQYSHRKFANPAPLGLCAFALTTFVLSCVNMHARGVQEPNIAVSVAFGYGGLVQLLAGMWEMAVGNTLGATALSSYGGFWISYAILLTPAWGITAADGPYGGDVGSVLGFFLTGWFIFTTIILLCTLKSSLAFFSLFLTLDLAFLFLMCEQYALDMGNMAAKNGLQKAGGFFGFLAAFLAWYVALNGLQDQSNSFFQVPLVHFPWSDKGRANRRAKVDHVA